MSEVKEIEYFEEEYPEFEYKTRGNSIIDQFVARSLVDAVSAMEFWSDEKFVPERVESVGGVGSGLYDVLMVFSGSLCNSLRDNYYHEAEIDTRSFIKKIFGNGRILVGVKFLEGNSENCRHDSIRYLDANTSECLVCGEQIPNSHLIGGEV